MQSIACSASAIHFEEDSNFDLSALSAGNDENEQINSRVPSLQKVFSIASGSEDALVSIADQLLNNDNSIGSDTLINLVSEMSVNHVNVAGQKKKKKRILCLVHLLVHFHFRN